MADIHILTFSGKQDSADCVFHVAIAAANNFAGKSYRDAIIEYLDSNFSPAYSGQVRTVSAVPDLATTHATEYANLQIGAVWESHQTVRFSANDTNAQKWAKIRAAYTSQSAAILAEIQDRLEFWGHNGAAV